MEEGGGPVKYRLACSAQVVDATLTEMSVGAKRSTEALALWLGKTRGQEIDVVEAYVPDYEAAVDWFHIPRSSMRSLMSHLRERRLQVCAQVHSHPGRAFHSVADDKWAVVRHVGALSLVLPTFGVGVEREQFLQAVAAYELSEENVWCRVSEPELRANLEIQPC